MAAKEASTSLQNVPYLSCENLRHFKETLKNLRSLDDKIIYKLNVSVPTQSFRHEIDSEAKCGTLYKELLAVYKIREDGIKKCIQTKSETIENIQKQLNEKGHDDSLVKSLRSEQTSLRLLQSELMVEEVVKTRSWKVFDERCWKSYTIPTVE